MYDFAVLPKECVEDGFPKQSLSISEIWFITSSLTCVVAALSKYTFICYFSKSTKVEVIISIHSLS